jgi:hypothetical protein
MATLLKLFVLWACGPVFRILALALVTASSRTEPLRSASGDKPSEVDPRLPPFEGPFAAAPLSNGPDGAPLLPVDSPPPTDRNKRVDQAWGPSPILQMLEMYHAYWQRQSRAPPGAVHQWPAVAEAGAERGMDQPADEPRSRLGGRRRHDSGVDQGRDRRSWGICGG